MQKETKPLAAKTLQWSSPCGTLILAALDDALLFVDWPDGWHHRTIVNRILRKLPVEFAPGESLLLTKAIRELSEYFEGERKAFELPLRFVGSDFQLAVWRALARVPYGGLVRYADIAREIGRPGAARAVGAAVGQNPFSIIVPCHRVIGRDGTLVGYGGGYAAKRRLLALEAGMPESELPFENGAESHAPNRLA